MMMELDADEPSEAEAEGESEVAAEDIETDDACEMEAAPADEGGTAEASAAEVAPPKDETGSAEASAADLPVLDRYADVHDINEISSIVVTPQWDVFLRGDEAHGRRLGRIRCIQGHMLKASCSIHPDEEVEVVQGSGRKQTKVMKRTSSASSVRAASRRPMLRWASGWPRVLLFPQGASTNC